MTEESKQKKDIHKMQEPADGSVSPGAESKRPIHQKEKERIKGAEPAHEIRPQER